MLITRRGQALRTSEEDIRSRAFFPRCYRIKLSSADELTGALRVTENQKMLVMTENGYGKRVEFSEFSAHGRGTGGQRIYTLSEKRERL